MYKVAIIGAGQLGSRHLQGLGLVNDLLSIQVVDISDDALAIAKERYNQISGSIHSVEYLNSISGLDKSLDVVIVASGSKPRKQIVKNLLEERKVRYMILEKFLFPGVSDYEEIETLLKASGTRCWVNCNMRMFDIYKEIKADLIVPVSMAITGSEWNIGSSAIHYLDVFSFLTGTTEIELECLLDENIIPSKRAGYIEFTGSVRGRYKDSILSMTSFKGPLSAVTLLISNPIATYFIREAANTTIFYSSEKNNWEWKQKESTMPYQSQLTNLVVEDLLKNGTCELSEYSHSSKLHTRFLSMIIPFVKKITKKEVEECLIT